LPDQFGVGVAEVFENLQGIPPSPQSGDGIPRQLVRLAQPQQRFGGQIALTHSAEQLQGVLVAGNGLAMIAEVVMDVSEAVPGVGLAVVVVEFLVPRQRFSTIVERFLVVPEVGVLPAEAVQDLGVSTLVAGGAVQLQGSSAVSERLGMSVLAAENETESFMDACLADQVAEGVEEVQRPSEVVLGVAVVSQPQMRAGEALVGVGLGCRVGQAHGGG
jgi:hypothetical protein